MEQVKTDLRVLRTRKLITDSFIALSNQQSFHTISVKDITEEAMINRATFYNHFLDKYDLLEQVVAEKLSLNLNCAAQSQPLSIEETITQVFFSLVSFVQSAEKHCDSQEEMETIDSIIQLELNNIFQTLLLEQRLVSDSELSQKLASVLTHTVVGMSFDYARSPKTESPEDYIEPLLPFIAGNI